MTDNPADTLFMGIRLRSGAFQGEIEIPVSLPKDDRQEAIIQWLELLEAALRVAEARRRGFKK